MLSSAISDTSPPPILVPFLTVFPPPLEKNFPMSLTQPNALLWRPADSTGSDPESEVALSPQQQQQQLQQGAAVVRCGRSKARTATASSQFMVPHLYSFWGVFVFICCFMTEEQLIVNCIRLVATFNPQHPNFKKLLFLKINQGVIYLFFFNLNSFTSYFFRKFSKKSWLNWIILGKNKRKYWRKGELYSTACHIASAFNHSFFVYFCIQ